MTDPEHNPQIPLDVWSISMAGLAVLHACDQPNGSYGYEIKQLMGTADDNTNSFVYRKIAQFVSKNLLQPHEPEETIVQYHGGKPVKRYKTTPLGRMVLTESLEIVGELAKAYSDPEDPHAVKVNN